MRCRVNAAVVLHWPQRGRGVGLLERLSTAVCAQPLEVGPARDWRETVKMHRGPKGALGVGSSSSEGDSGSDRLRRTGRLAQRRGGAVAKVEVGLNLDGGGRGSGRQWRARFCEVLAENVTRQDHERVRQGV